MWVFNNNKYKSLRKTDYTTIIKIYENSIVLEIGENKPIIPRKRKGFISVSGVRKELLEYHYGIYRMFPCGKQHRYHMQYLHVPEVTSRRIKG